MAGVGIIFCIWRIPNFRFPRVLVSMGMMRLVLVMFGLARLGGGLWAQEGWARHNIDVGMSGVFPLSGYRTYEFSPGPAWHPGYELRLSKLLGAEVGWTQAWLPGSACNSSGCEHPRRTLEFLDYGLRTHLAVADGRVDLSVGVGGGYIWFEHNRSDANATLVQYSAKAAVALDRRKRIRAGFTIRTWRDLGRPTQQWLSTTAGVVLGLGGRP